MKNVLIVIENFKIGGIQKSLINLLEAISKDYVIDIAALDFNGEYKSKIPKDVNIVELPYHLVTFAKPRAELHGSWFLFLYKMLFYFLTKLTNKGIAFSLVSPFFRIRKKYDVSISYTHSCSYKGVNGICPEFVLNKTKADKKICFIHCDYEHSGFHSSYNDKLYSKFDRIACCSNSVRKIFLKFNPQLEGKTYTVRNFFDLNIIRFRNRSLTKDLDDSKLRIVSIARLSEEKGLGRAIEALYLSGRNDIEYRIIGNGPIREGLKQLINEYNLTQAVFLMGELSDPYKLLQGSDYLIVPSYNEAAPIVFDEAHLLQTSIIATRTTSTDEMLGQSDLICDNSLKGLVEMFENLEKPNVTHQNEFVCTNDMQLKQLHELLKD